MSHELKRLTTRAGIIDFPAFVPVTTFGSKYPLDDLIRPYLPRLAQAALVSHYYAREMKAQPRIPLMVDSGGFASLLPGAEVITRGKHGLLRVPGEEHSDELSPSSILEFQEQHADIAFTLDFPIPPQMPRKEASKRITLTLENAAWALHNRRRRDLPLYAGVQGLTVSDYKKCAKELATMGFDGLAIGGLVPRLKDLELTTKVIAAVRDAAPNLPIHAFGIGKPEFLKTAFELGVQSADSSSFVKLAANGRLWADPSFRLPDASPVERLQLAIANLASATGANLPLPVSTALNATFSRPRKAA